MGDALNTVGKVTGLSNNPILGGLFGSEHIPPHKKGKIDPKTIKYFSRSIVPYIGYDRMLEVYGIEPTGNRNKDYPRLIKEYSRQGLTPAYADAIRTSAGALSDAYLDQLSKTSPRLAELRFDLFNQYGPQFAQAWDATQRAANPEFYAGREALMGNLTNRLNSFDQLQFFPGLEDFFTQKMDAQNVRMGREGSPYSAQFNARNLADLNAGLYESLPGQMTSALDSLFPQANIPLDLGFTGMPGTPYSESFGPMSTNQMWQNGFDMDMLNKQLKAQKDMQMTDKLFELGSSAFSAAGQMLPMLCWVAREVYGVDNPRWLQFREWMLTKAPQWLRSLYLHYGERFAKWIHNKPAIKAVIRRLMDLAVDSQGGSHAVA